VSNFHLFTRTDKHHRVVAHYFAGPDRGEIKASE
jgi:hypothetical protein